MAERMSTRYGGVGATVQTAGRFLRNAGKEILKTPVRLTYSLIDTPRVLMGKEPLPPVDLGYGLGEARSAQRRAVDLVEQQGYSGANAALRAGSEAILDTALIGGLAGQAAKAGAVGATKAGGAQNLRYLDKADDLMRETDQLLRLNPSMATANASRGLERSLNNALKPQRTGGREYTPRQNFKNAHPEDVQEMVKFVDDVRLPKRSPNVSQEITMRRLAERFGINPNQSNSKIANEFVKRLDKNPQLINK